MGTFAKQEVAWRIKAGLIDGIDDKTTTRLTTSFRRQLAPTPPRTCGFFLGANLKVTLGPQSTYELGPFIPRERTYSDRWSMSVSCHERKCLAATAGRPLRQDADHWIIPEDFKQRAALSITQRV
jgi:hypothetical protein